jgi:predicted nucleic-acid-binding Zn-ribbon protein
MDDVGRTLHNSLLSSKQKLHTGKCQNCGYTLELYEIEIKKSRRVMRCERCGMLHFYKKDILGRWSLYKASKSEFATG